MNSPTVPDAAVPGLDPLASRRWQAMPRTSSPWLHEEVASRMVERLKWFREAPTSWLHWEPVTGGLQAHRRLREVLPQAASFVMADRMDEALAATREPSARTWNPLRWGRDGGAQAADESTRVGMLWANMALHLEPRPETLLRRWHRHVDTGGFLMFSCLGPDSLRELRTIYAREGWPAPAHDFTDMHDWGDMLVHSGFAEPVMDMERITLSYSGAEPLLQELRELGRNLSSARFPACRSRFWRQRLITALEDGLPRDDQGRLLLTFEIVYGHAFKAAARLPVGPSTTVPVDDLRAMLRAGRR